MEIFTLPCGLRVVYEHRVSPIVHCGYVVSAGTRHETGEQSGMAHFIEHMSFKGTRRRTSYDILNELERGGGELNAYTTKQETVYYATIQKRYFRQAVDLLSDIVFRSTYPQDEIDKEAEVICDEIDSYRDSPSELIFDDFEALMYPGQPLGRSILGDKERLRRYTTGDARAFADRWYHPRNAVFYFYGGISRDMIERVLDECLDADELGAEEAKNNGFTVPSPAIAGTTRTVHKETHQAHVVLGAPTFAGTDERRYALALLNNMLGGPGMNSRLNLSLRERAGLVYSVDAYLNTYPDTGFWSVYFGCDPDDVERCCDLAADELARFCDTPLLVKELKAAQLQLCGQIVIATENYESYALNLGKTYAHYGTRYDLNTVIKRLKSVTPAELQAVAREVYAPARLTTLIYR